MKYLFITIFLIVSFVAVYSVLELNNSDKERYRLKSEIRALRTSNDSIYYSIDSIKLIAIEAENKANMYRLKVDSLTDYQNKIYVFYSNKIKEVRNVPDSDVLDVFSSLLSE